MYKTTTQLNQDSDYNMFTGPNIITDGLVLHLDAANTKSYPGSGTTWYDVSGNGNTGTLINGPTFNSGNGGSIVFDGSNDYSITSTNIGSMITGDVTFNVWVKINGDSSSGINGVISNEWHSSTTGINLYTRNVNNQLWISGGNGSSRPAYSNTIPNFNYTYWNNLTLTHTDNTAVVYVNGEKVWERALTVVHRSTSPLILGRWAPSYGSYLLNGEIASAQAYTRALTAQEIQQNYNATKSRFNL